MWRAQGALRARDSPAGGRGGMGGGAMLGGPPLPKHGVRGGLGLVRRAALVCAMLLVGAGEAAHVTWEEPELEILEPVDGSVVRLLEGDSAVLRFGVNFLKGQCNMYMCVCGGVMVRHVCMRPRVHAQLHVRVLLALPAPVRHKVTRRVNGVRPCSPHCGVDTLQAKTSASACR